jgi:magnesium transporter
MAPAHTRAYRGGTLVAEGFPVEEVSRFVGDPDATVWVDLLSPGEDELAVLAGELGLHELAVEDALSPHQRPKLDVYPSHLFVSCHSVAVDVESAQLVESEINAFADHRWLVTVRKDDGFDLVPVLRRWEQSVEMTVHGAAFLLYGLLDAVIDGYFRTLDAFDDYYEEASEGLFADQPLRPVEQRHWFRMRRSLARFHRVVVPMRETVSGLMRRQRERVDEALLPYYQDTYDHILRVSESSDALRDLVATIVETDLSLRDFRQNQVMKKVTSWAAIIAVPTLITGFYGMNVPYPGSLEHWGVVSASVLMVGLSVGLYLQFRRRGWL